MPGFRSLATSHSPPLRPQGAAAIALSRALRGLGTCQTAERVLQVVFFIYITCRGTHLKNGRKIKRFASPGVFERHELPICLNDTAFPASWAIKNIHKYPHF
jgi:hypothetical protein